MYRSDLTALDRESSLASMVRKLRVQYDGAIYHVLSRACRGGDIFLDKKDWQNPVDGMRWFTPMEQRLKPDCPKAFQGARRKGDLKIKIARRLRQETTMTWAWIAEHLAMGAGGHAANRVRANK
jgi:hypothetical protein